MRIKLLRAAVVLPVLYLVVVCLLLLMRTATGEQEWNILIFVASFPAVPICTLADRILHWEYSLGSLIALAAAHYFLLRLAIDWTVRRLQHLIRGIMRPHSDGGSRGLGKKP